MAATLESQWTSSEMVALIRILWLDDLWFEPVRDAIRSAIGDLTPVHFDALVEPFSGQSCNEELVNRFVLALGALAVLGAWIEPFREGARISFRHSGKHEEGVIISFTESPFLLCIEGGKHISGAVECKSLANANGLEVQQLSEVDILPECFSTIPDVAVLVAKLFTLTVDSDSYSRCMLRGHVRLVWLQLIAAYQMSRSNAWPLECWRRV